MKLFHTHIWKQECKTSGTQEVNEESEITESHASYMYSFTPRKTVTKTITKYKIVEILYLCEDCDEIKKIAMKGEIIK